MRAGEGVRLRRGPDLLAGLGELLVGEIKACRQLGELVFEGRDLLKHRRVAAVRKHANGREETKGGGGRKKKGMEREDETSNTPLTQKNG